VPWNTHLHGASSPAADNPRILCFRLRRFFFVPNKSLDLAWLRIAEQNLRLMTPLQSFVEWQELVAMWFSAWGRLGVSLTRPHILGVKGKLKKHLKNSEKNSEKPVDLCPAWALGEKAEDNTQGTYGYIIIIMAYIGTGTTIRTRNRVFFFVCLPA